AIRADQFTTDLIGLSSPFRVKLWLSAKHGRHVAKPQGPRTLGKNSGCRASNQRGHVRSDCQHAAISVAESKRVMGLRMSHAALEQRVVINRRRGDLFIRPAG